MFDYLSSSNLYHNRIINNLIFYITTTVTVTVVMSMYGMDFKEAIVYNSLWSYIYYFLLLDFIMYVQHVLLHKVNFLWTMHALHHSDMKLDVSTNFRHHPFEIAISSAVTFAFIMILDIPYSIFALYFIINNAFQLLQHSGWDTFINKIPILNRLLVTTNFHSVHHSADSNDANSNYGTVLTIWDYIFQTYRKSNVIKQFGIEGIMVKNKYTFIAMLALPFAMWTNSDSTLSSKSIQ